MKVRAPGKLILSGEHAIVYGKPALAIAVNRYAQVEAQAHLLPLISFDLGDLAYQEVLRFASLDRLKARIKQKYRRFLRGEFKIRHVLQKPVELAQFALSLFFEVMKVRPTQGLKIKVQSDIPIGCGMGSSAAIILAILHAIAQHLKLEVTPQVLFRLALEAENIQHGHSSGLDLQISQQGGCLYMQEGQIYKRTLPDFPFYVVNTGAPLSTTGECVVQVEKLFRQSQRGEDFAAVTRAMDSAVQTQNALGFKESVRANHQLLAGLGVVPLKVQQFIAAIEADEGAAKICGAGTVSGEAAGALLVLSQDLHKLTQLCAHYHYSLLPVAIEPRGVHVV